MKKRNRLVIVKLNKNNLNIFENKLELYFNEINNPKISKRKIKLISSNLIKRNDIKLLIKYNIIFVGFIVLRIHKNLLNQKICTIKDFFINKEFRGRGLGKKIIIYFKNNLKKQKIKIIKIEILKTNKSAEKFWKFFNIKFQKNTYIFNP